jgi:hypothetical protein
VNGQRQRAGIWLAAAVTGLLVAGCVYPYYYQAPPVPENAIRFQAGYPQVFDRIVRTLEADGFVLATTDQEHGIVETRPRELKAAATPSGPFEYQTVVSIRVGGTRNSAWATVQVLLVPSYPKEQDRIIEQLKRGVQAPVVSDGDDHPTR